MMSIRTFIRHGLRSLGLIAIACALVSCERVYPVRTLPSWVRSVYIPMAQNTSFEPGVEETLTQILQREFLADGRLSVARKQDADIQLSATITDYWILIDKVDGDRIPRRQEINIVTRVLLFDPLNNEVPVADLGLFETRAAFFSDFRSIFQVTEPTAKTNALTILALQIVNRTINGYPTSVAGLPGGARLFPGAQSGLVVPTGSPARQGAEYID